MTGSQRAYLMAKPCRRYPNGGLWWMACQFQGWSFDDRNLRIAQLSEAVGRRITSATELNQTGDFDAVIRHLGTQAGSVKRAAETDHEGEARRTMNNVRQLLAELEELHPDPAEVVAELLRTITRARYGVTGIEDLSITPKIWTKGGKTHEQLPELERFRRTLNAMINGKDGLRAKMKNHDHEWGESGFCVHCHVEQPAQKEEVPF